MAIKKNPELFPAKMISEYKMKEIKFSKKMKIKTRRILVDCGSYTIRLSFVMPDTVGFVEYVESPLFLRKFAVFFGGL
ncbi:hypothetical protein [Desulfocicer vacuolatum]|uniref:hypothetical protein n=1 Tax=Desulfocicer vacuolatum TaxID=2298 RepID=UPI000A07B5A9|nr:hypothetical protein [Desulfocicer vacuolatum]